MDNVVLLIDADTNRRAAMRGALERRGQSVFEAGSVNEIVETVATLDRAPNTILVSAQVAGASSDRVANLLKRSWPSATVIRENAPDMQIDQRSAPSRAVAI